jgi:hypothetical protein
MPFRTTFPHGRLRHVHTFSSRPIRRWPCLIRSGRAVVAVLEVVAAVPEVVAAVEGVVRVEAAQAEALVAVAAVVRAAVVRAEVAQEVVVKAAPAEALAAEEKAAPEAVAREAGPAVAAGTILAPITLTIRLTTSRGQLCRHSHLRLRPTSRSWLRSRTGQAAS